MKKILIESTESTPEINFDPETHKLLICGYSIENVRKLFMIVYDWLDLYYEQILSKADKKIFEVHPVNLILKFRTINSSTTRSLLDLISELIKYQEEGINIQIDWHYESDDDIMLEVGEELSDMVDFDFNYHEM